MTGERAVALALAAALAACSAGDEPGDAAPGARGWHLVRDDLDRVPLCVWRAPSGTVFVGGGGLAADRPTLLLAGDGRSFAEVELDGGASTETIWWIHGPDAPRDGTDEAWAVGERGAAWHHVGTTPASAPGGATWTRVPTGTDATLYGVWAAAPDDAWAVGGSPGGAGANDVLLHWDGAAWSAVEPPQRLGVAFFKVWGSAPDDVFVVGQDGVALHRDASGWTEMDTGAKTTLFTVHGRGSRVVAVGGPPATLLAWSGGAFAKRGLPQAASGTMSGVYFDGVETWIAGERHQIFHAGDDGAWQDDTGALSTTADFHAIWADGAGSALAVGGNWVALVQPGAVPKGVVARLGD